MWLGTAKDRGGARLQAEHRFPTAQGHKDSSGIRTIRKGWMEGDIRDTTELTHLQWLQGPSRDTGAGSPTQWCHFGSAGQLVRVNWVQERYPKTRQSEDVRTKVSLIFSEVGHETLMCPSVPSGEEKHPYFKDVGHR